MNSICLLTSLLHSRKLRCEWSPLWHLRLSQAEKERNSSELVGTGALLGQPRPDNLHHDNSLLHEQAKASVLTVLLPPLP